MSVTSAADLVRLAQRDTATVAEQLRRHPYILAVEAGNLAREHLGRFAGEQWHIISSDLRSVAHLVSRYGDTPAGGFFSDVLAGEGAALGSLKALGRALGLGEGDLRAYEPLPGAHVYTAYMAWLAMYGSAAGVAAAYLVNFPAWGESCGRLSRALQARYGLQPDDVAFFDQFAEEALGFEEAALAVIQLDLDGGADPVLARRSVRLLQAYELMYWDTLYRAAMETPSPHPLPEGEGT